MGDLNHAFAKFCGGSVGKTMEKHQRTDVSNVMSSMHSTSAGIAAKIKLKTMN
jgi:hypothetical protein